MAYGGFATYYPMMRLPKDRKEVGAYVYPCTTIGTIGLVLGLIVCSHVVESKTIKKKNTPCNSLNTTMVWLQQGKTGNDQSVDSYAVIFTKGENPIITSKRSTSGRMRRTLSQRHLLGVRNDCLYDGHNMRIRHTVRWIPRAAHPRNAQVTPNP